MVSESGRSLAPRASVAVSILVLGLLMAGCAGPGGELSLKLGTMMPLTGALNNLGPDMERGAKLAIEDVNNADVGLKIQPFHEDDKTTDTSAAPNTFNLLAGKGITALAGPCCSGVTASILDLAVQNEIVVSSPSATSPTLTDRDNKGYFWRVPPSDAVQGKVLAGLVKENNVTAVNMIIIDNAYGNGLTDVFKKQFTESLGGAVLKVEKYPEGSNSYSTQVDSVCTPKPQAIVLVGYIDEGAAILKEMQAKGCLGGGLKLFGSEGLYDQGFPDKADKNTEGQWLAAGFKGTTPQAGNSTVFIDKFMARWGHTPALYAHESYDAVMYVALAALKAESVDGKDIAEALLDIANAPGEKVTDFEEAAQLIKDGEDIDYVGYAHDFTFDDKHEPNKGVYSYWEVGTDGKIRITDTGKSA